MGRKVKPEGKPDHAAVKAAPKVELHFGEGAVEPVIALSYFDACRITGLTPNILAQAISDGHLTIVRAYGRPMILADTLRRFMASLPRYTGNGDVRVPSREDAA